MKSESFHVAVINDIKTKIEQGLVLACLRPEHRAHIKLQLVEHRLVNNAVAVDEVAQE